MKRIFILLLTFTLLIGGTFAYFTDGKVFTTTATAGTVEIALENYIDLFEEEYDVFGPGDIRTASFEVVNKGNKSIAVRTTIALTVESENQDLTFSGDSKTQSEFDLYLASDVELTENEGYVPKEGAKPIQYKSIKDNVIFYTVNEFRLNGNSELYSEVETINGTGSFKHLYDYVLIFKNDTSEDWQSATIRMDIVVEAKQYEHTAGGWLDLPTKEITQGSITVDAVLGREE